MGEGDLTGTRCMYRFRPCFVAAVDAIVADDELVPDRVVVADDEPHQRARAYDEMVGREVAVPNGEGHGRVAGPEWFLCQRVRRAYEHEPTHADRHRQAQGHQREAQPFRPHR